MWPKGKLSDESSEDLEEKKTTTRSNVAIVEEPPKDAPIDASRYGSWNKLTRVTARVFWVIQKWRGRIQDDENTAGKIPTLNVEDIRKAEFYWYRHIQRSTYKDEIQTLENRGVLRKSRILKLDPKFDEVNKVLRVGGRLQNSELKEETKHQVILPHNHPIVDKIVMDMHEECMHAGSETVVTNLRSKIWVTQVRRDVKRILNKCLICEVRRACPSKQKMAPLPSDRVSFSPAFSVVGVDFAGPLYVLEVRGKDKPEKVYICLFTCATSRMVHLELTHRLTTDEFLQAFRRMVNRRGICNTMWSDNARTFKSAGSFIKKVFVRANSIKETELDTDALTTQLAAKGIEWKFIVERAPWRGGWWERLVRSVKESLRRVLGKALLRYTELYTVLTDVEAAINSRPLTTISDDSRDLEPLTPAHLALGRPLMGIPDVAEETWEAADTIVTQRYLYRQKLANHFWKRWQNEYLPSLTVRKKWETEKPLVEVGSIVLISEDRTPRGSWLLGRVDEVYMGKDEICRTVAVRTKKGVLKRPIQR
ncbi:uncharacterized protein LOC135492958 [Lineus longissimus]|uniref:uncharacterized protein LOC135492958 n=1 Tax=Lineus longissimus TaxID=88925 RepID=UPI00315D0657